MLQARGICSPYGPLQEWHSTVRSFTGSAQPVFVHLPQGPATQFVRTLRWSSVPSLMRAEPQRTAPMGNNQVKGRTTQTPALGPHVVTKEASTTTHASRKRATDPEKTHPGPQRSRRMLRNPMDPRPEATR